MSPRVVTCLGHGDSQPRNGLGAFGTSDQPLPTGRPTPDPVLPHGGGDQSRAAGGREGGASTWRNAVVLLACRTP